MARVSVGAITIADIQDGFNPISVVLGNENHSFAADSNGAVSPATRDAFECEIFVYLGATRLQFVNGSPDESEYTIQSVTSSSAATWIASVRTDIVANQAVIKITTIPAGITDAAKSTNLIVTLAIANSLGNITTAQVVITLNKAVQGAGGTIISLVPNRQTFRFDEDNVTDDGDITMTIQTEGTTGPLSAFKSFNGGSFSPLAQGNGQGQAKTLNLVNGGSVVISAANFGTYNVLSIRVSGDAGGVDVVSIARLQDGKTGPAAITVSITAEPNGVVFKNNLTPASKTLTARVFDNSNGSEIDPANITYSWTRDGQSVGTDSPTLVITPLDVDDNSSNEFACLVSVS